MADIKKKAHDIGQKAGKKTNEAKDTAEDKIKNIKKDDKK